jgi:WD40 repeat protein
MSINPIKQFIYTFVQMVSAVTATHPAPQTVVTRPNSEINHFYTVPNDLLYCIFSQLPDEIHALKLINRHFCVFISNCFPLLESILIQRFPDSYKNSQSSVKFCSEAQSLYNDCTNIRKNIEAGKYRTQTIVVYKDLIREFQIDEGYLCSLKDWSGTVKICELKSGKELRTLSFRGVVECLQAHQGSLYVGQDDGTITIWDIKSGGKLRTLSGHGDAVICLQIYEGRLYSVSADDTIKIWDIEKGEELRMLSGHGNDRFLERTSIQIQDDRLYIGSGKDTITIWDVKNGEKLRTFSTGHGDTTTLKIHEGSLYVGSSNGAITIWDLKSKEKLRTLHGHSHYIIDLQIIDGYLYSSSWDGSTNVWDLASSRLLQTFKEFDGSPICSQVYKGYFYSASTANKTTIKVWDFRFAPLTPYTK